MALPYDITVYNFQLQTVLEDFEYTFTRFDNKYVVFNLDDNWMLIYSHNINSNKNITLYRGFIPKDIATFEILLQLVKE